MRVYRRRDENRWTYSEVRTPVGSEGSDVFELRTEVWPVLDDHPFFTVGREHWFEQVPFVVGHLCTDVFVRSRRDVLVLFSVIGASLKVVSRLGLEPRALALKV